jgi:hypothetical protein
LALSVLAVIGIGAFGLVDADFTTKSPWFFIGLTLFVVVAVATNVVLRERRTRTLNDEFETGYRVGYRAGRRASLTVARPAAPARPSRPIPLRPKRTQKTNEPSWRDIESFPPGDTRRP